MENYQSKYDLICRKIFNIFRAINDQLQKTQFYLLINVEKFIHVQENENEDKGPYQLDTKQPSTILPKFVSAGNNSNWYQQMKQREY